MSKELFELLYNEIVVRGSGIRTTKMVILLKTSGCKIETETQYVVMHDCYLEITALTGEDSYKGRMYIPYENISHLVWVSD